MCRQRFKADALCSSRNYRASKRVHKDYLKRTHEDRVKEIESMTFKITNPRVVHHCGRPYLMIFGHKVRICKDEVERAIAAGYAIHYE